MYPVQVISCLLKIRPHLVHIQHEFFLFGGLIEAALFPLLLLAIRLTGFPIVVTLHGVPIFEHIDEDFQKGFFLNRVVFSARILLRPFVEFICGLSSFVIVHSDFAKRVLVGQYGIDPGKVRVIPHGIDECLYNNQTGESLKHDFVQILFFGFITPTKGIEDLIRAFMLISNPHLRLIVAGGRHRRDDSYFNDISKLAKTDSRINIAGYASDRLASEFFVKSDFVVLPHRYQLSASGALAMAIAYEKPVIVTNTPYFSEIIKDGYNGLFVEVGDVDGLKSKIEMLANNSGLLRRLSQGCGESKAALSWPRLVPLLWSLYTKALNKNSD